MGSDYPTTTAMAIAAVHMHQYPAEAPPGYPGVEDNTQMYPPTQSQANVFSSAESEGDGVRRTPNNDEHGRKRHVNYDTTPPHGVRDSVGHVSNDSYLTESHNTAELRYGRERNEQYIPSETDRSINNFPPGKDKGTTFRSDQCDVANNNLEIHEQSYEHCDPSSPHNLRNASIHIFSSENSPNREETMHVATKKERHKQPTHNQQNRGENLQDDTERRQSGRDRTERGNSTDDKVKRGVTLQARSERMDMAPCYLELDAIREQGERTDFTRARPERSSFTVWPSPANDFRQVDRETRRPATNDDDTNSCHWYVLGFFLGLEGIVNCPMFLLSFALLMSALAALSKGKDRAYKILTIVTWVSIIIGILMPVIITIAVIQGGKSSVRDKT